MSRTNKMSYCCNCNLWLAAVLQCFHKSELNSESSGPSSARRFRNFIQSPAASITRRTWRARRRRLSIRRPWKALHGLEGGDVDKFCMPLNTQRNGSCCKDQVDFGIRSSSMDTEGLVCKILLDAVARRCSSDATVELLRSVIDARLEEESVLMDAP